MKNIFHLVLIAALCCSPFFPALAQDTEMNRFAVEKDWVSWQKGIVQPDSVKKLFIKDKEPLNYEALRTFQHLEGLIVYDSPLPDLEFLADFPHLRILELEGNQLPTLEGIQNLRQLEEFSCSSNFISDISPLDSLLHLRMIKLYDNEFPSLKPIAHLENVTHLDVSKSKIRSLAPIAHWKQLKVLSVYKCYELRDVSALSAYPDLTDLNISFLDVPNFSLSLIAGHNQLQNLRVQGMVSSNEELKYIMQHTDLEQLTMGKNDSVTCIDSLRFLTKLKYLDIHSNNVSDVGVVRNFPDLVKIVMYRNKVRDISPILSCPDLRSLFMHENPVVDYSPLYQMGYVQHLNLSQDDFDERQAMQLRKALRNTRISFY